MPAWLEKLKDLIKAHPAVAGGAALGSSVVIFLVIKNHHAAAAASSNTPAAESTPGAADMSAMHAMNGFDVSSMAGLPYGYVSQNGPVDNYPQTSTGATPSPTPTPSPASTPTSSPSPASMPNTVTQTTNSTGSSTANNVSVQRNTNNSSGQQDPNPYAGLLGPKVAVDFQKRTFTSPTIKKSTHLPIPDNDMLVQGGENRVWYIDQGIQHLLTDGIGQPVTNSGFPVGSPQNTPPGHGSGGFAGPVNAGRETVASLSYKIGDYI